MDRDTAMSEMIAAATVVFCLSKKLGRASSRTFLIEPGNRCGGCAFFSFCFSVEVENTMKLLAMKYITGPAAGARSTLLFETCVGENSSDRKSFTIKKYDGNLSVSTAVKSYMPKATDGRGLLIAKCSFKNSIQRLKNMFTSTSQKGSQREEQYFPVFKFRFIFQA